MKKDLRRNTRGISHYLNFKNDFERESDRLFDSLPLFFRIMYLDQPNPWINQINRFDFLRLAVVSSDFNDYQAIKIGSFKYKKITPSNGQPVLEINLNDFFQSPILKSESFEYTVQDFILCHAYNGGIHMEPDKNIEKSNFLYENLFLKFPEFTFDLTISIGKILIDIFDEMYTLLAGNNDGHSTNKNFQAKVVDKGKLLDGIYFERAYMQFPISAKKKKGIRFYLKLKLLKKKKDNPILCYGHRKKGNFQVSIFQNEKKLIIKVIKGIKKTIVLDIEDLLSNYFMLELAIYPNGKISVAVNNYLRKIEDLNEQVEIVDGKIILGSTLNGQKFGEFYERIIVTQSIDEFNVTRNLGIYALKLLNVKSIELPFNMIERQL